MIVGWAVTEVGRIAVDSGSRSLGSENEKKISGVINVFRII